MVRRKTWTKKKRERAARKAAVTRRERKRVIEQAGQSQETDYALLIPFGTWIEDSIKLRERIDTGVSMKKGPRSEFSVADVVAGMVVAYEAGVVHSSHLDKLVPEVALARSIGLEHFFGATTATDVMKQAGSRDIGQMRQVLTRICMENVAASDGNDIDVVVDTTGHPSNSHRREQVKVGYCNGRKEPCLKSGRVVVNGLPAFVDVYPGNENPEEPFTVGLAMARLLCRRHPDRRVHLSADSASASELHLRQLHRLEKQYQNFRYSLCINLPGPHSKPAQTVCLAKAKPKKQWKSINSTTRVIDVGYRKVYADSEHRTRQIVVERTEEKAHRNKRGHIVIEQIPRCYLIATNFSKPERKGKQIFRGYHQRTVVESSIKDGKQSFHIQRLPHLKFNANRLFLLIVTLAQLLGCLYHRLLLPTSRQATTGQLIASIRSDFWKIHGRLIDATHLLIDVVYRRYKLVRKICSAVQLRFGIHIAIPGFNSS